MTSVLNVDTIADKAGTGPVSLTKQAAAKAFHGYGDQSAGALHANSETFNIASYVDTATGRSRLNLTNAMASSSKYSVVGSTQGYDYGNYSITSSQYECGNTNSSLNFSDGVTHAVIHGDLA